MSKPSSSTSTTEYGSSAPMPPIHRMENRIWADIPNTTIRPGSLSCKTDSWNIASHNEVDKNTINLVAFVEKERERREANLAKVPYSTRYTNSIIPGDEYWKLVQIRAESYRDRWLARHHLYRRRHAGPCVVKGDPKPTLLYSTGGIWHNKSSPPQQYATKPQAAARATRLLPNVIAPTWTQVFHYGCTSTSTYDRVKRAMQLADWHRWDVDTIQQLVETFVERATTNPRTKLATMAKFASEVYQAFGDAGQEWAKHAFKIDLGSAVKCLFQKWWDTTQATAICVGRSIKQVDLASANRLLEFIADLYEEELITQSDLWKMVRQLMNNINVIEHVRALRLILDHRGQSLWEESRGRRNKEILLRVFPRKAEALPDNTSVERAGFGRQELRALIADIITLVDPWESSAYLECV
ncbi:hypothetical protein NEOLEDRAFT_1167288 [Neolentinus lepideus HHB14362 ss-1]|uniref:Uncharacterized protein n=1 Tax=Neolentinus lepideus HHB14362 ss-1 TaxID=1314782 RepID=A0A165UVY3_9AGAM|nr:hypothetical protein NEOLEDRAFT_1167288 [Neolentinus lepideus HHB14362 ss-1]